MHGLDGRLRGQATLPQGFCSAHEFLKMLEKPMKPRARDLIRIGQLQPGPLNAITDVPGVRVGHSNVRGRSARDATSAPASP
jgi:hypothetical protein